MRWLAVALVLFMGLAYAQTVTINPSQPILIPAIQDTYVCNVNTAPATCNTTLNFGNASSVSLWEFDTGFAPKSMNSFFQYPPNSTVVNKVITSMRHNWRVVVSQCSTTQLYKKLFLIGNDTWDENVITGLNTPDLATAVDITGNVGHLFVDSPTLLNRRNNSVEFVGLATSVAASQAPTLFRLLYTDNNATIFTDGNAYNSGGSLVTSCGSIFGTIVGVGSSESVHQPYLNISTADFHSRLFQGTDTPTIYFDFESFTAKTSFFTEADLLIDMTTNQVTPQGSVTAAFRTSESNTANTLATQTCQSVTGYSSSVISGVGAGFPFTIDADIICVDLSSQHNGRAFFGAIKIVNATNVRGGAAIENDFYAGIYSPDYTTFSSISFSPSPPQAFRNNTAVWTSSRALTSNIRFQILDTETSQQSGFITVNGNASVFSTSHSLIINRDLISLSGSRYQYTFQTFGTTVNGTTFYSGFQTTTVQPFIAGLESLTQGVHVITQDQFGDAMPATCRMVFFENNATQLLTKASSNINGNEVCVFNTLGANTYNLTVTAEGRTPFSETFNVTLSDLPFFKVVRLSPFQTCQIAAAAADNITCISLTRSWIDDTKAGTGANITSFYCQFESGFCLKKLNGTCIHQGGYVGYACFDGFHPERFPINSTAPTGLTGRAGEFPDTVGETVGNFFGVDAESALAFIWLFASMIVGIVAGFYTKNGIVSIIGFATMLTAGFLIGWIPAWIIILLVLVAATGAVIIGRGAMSGSSGSSGSG